jgi:hypothetical protein
MVECSSVAGNFTNAGACSSHGGIDCNRFNLYTNKVICSDGWEDSTVDYTDVCTETLGKLVLYLAMSQCREVLSDRSASDDAAGICVQENREKLLKQFRPNCIEAVETNLTTGESYCTTYRDFCDDDKLREQTSFCSSQASYQLPPSAGAYAPSKKDPILIAKVRGQILLQVQAHGEAWYIDPADSTRYYMANGSVAYSMMRSFGLGITTIDLNNIPSVDAPQSMLTAPSSCASNALANRLKGKILLQVQEHGEAWYVDPRKCRKIYMKDGDAAYQIMRYLGLGITDADLEKIPSGVTQ